MSAENVALVSSVYSSFASGQIPEILAILDPDVEWVENGQTFLPQHGVHRGPAAVVEGVFAPTMAAFEEFAVVPERFHDAGDVVVVEGRAVGVTRAGGKLDARAAWIWTVRDGLIVGNVNYHDSDAWREALEGQ